jgi:hypothetical protein
MNYRTTVVLLVLVAAAVIIYALTPDLTQALLVNGPQAETVDAGSLHTLEQDLAADRLTRIEVDHAGDRVILQRSPGGEWSMPGNWPVRKPEAGELVNLLGGLHSRFRPIPLDESSNLQEYGLARPAVAVSLMAGDQKHDLHFGDGAEVQNRFSRPTYVRVDDKPEVVRLDPGIVAILSRPQSYYQQRRLFEQERVARDTDSTERVEQLLAQTISTRAPDGAYSLERSGNDWELVLDKVRDRADPDKIKTILRAVPDVWADAFVDRARADLSACGLEPPAQTLRVTQPSGDTVTLQIGRCSRLASRMTMRQAPSFDGRPQRPQPEVSIDVFRYAKLQNNDQVFEIRTDKLTGWQVLNLFVSQTHPLQAGVAATAADRLVLGQALKDVFVAGTTLRDPALAHFRAEDARRVDIRHGGHDLVLSKGEDGWQLQGSHEEALETSKVNELLDKLSGMQARDKDILDNQNPKDYGLTQPAAVITVTVQEESKSKPETSDKTEKEKAKTPGKTVRFVLGTREADKGKLYVQVDNLERINVISDDSLLKLAQRPAVAYRAHTLDIKGPGVASIHIHRGKEEVALTSDKDTWRLTAPVQAEVDHDKATQLSEALGPLDAVEYLPDTPAPDALAQTYGLGKDALSVRVEFTDKARATPTLVLGKQRPGKADYFAKLAGSEVIFVVNAKVVTALDHGSLDWIKRDLLTLQPESIQKIRSTPKAGGPVVLERKDRDWRVVESPAPAFSADHTTMEAIVGVWSKLWAERFAAYGPQVKWPEYGLVPPAETVTVTVQQPAANGKSSKTDHTVELGKPVPDLPGARYARVDNGPGVAVLAAPVVEQLTHSYIDFVSRDILHLNADQIEAILIHDARQDLEVARRGDHWRLSKPIEARADDRALEALANQLATLRAARIAAYPAKDPKAFGLDSPATVVTIRLTAAGGKSEAHVLKLGNFDGTGVARGRFALVDSSPAVVVLPAKIAEQLTASPLEFRDRSLVHFAAADRVTLQRGTRTAVFTVADGTWKLTSPIEAAAEDKDLKDFVTAAGNLRADKLVAEKPADLKPYGLERPTVTWRFQAAGKDVLELQVGKREKIQEGGKEADGPRCFAKLAKGDLVVLLSPEMTRQVLAEYRTRNVWAALDASQIEELTYTPAGGSRFRLEKMGGDWQIGGKPDPKVNPETIRETLDALGSLKAEQYLTDKGVGLSLYGLEPPRLVLEIQSPAGKRILHIGNQEGTSKRYYARVPESDQAPVFALSEADARRLVRTLAGFTTPTKAAATIPDHRGQ